MTIAVLFPREEEGAMAERAAGWQAESRLRRADEVAAIVSYEHEEAAEDVVADVNETHVLVVLDPRVIVERDVATRLRDALVARGAAFVVPVQAEPLLYLCATETLRRERRVLRRSLGDAAVVEDVAARKWQRDPDPDLLPFIPTTASSVLHVACGDGSLGARLKERQRCRVIGIESDRALAALARRRLDDLYMGELTHVVSILDQTFHCIVTGDVLPHLVDPWSFLADLRRVSASGGTLVVSLPNVANVRVIQELVEGRFETATQLRFFTRQSIEELMDIAGWTIEAMHAASDDSRFHVVARRA